MNSIIPRRLHVNNLLWNFMRRYCNKPPTDESPENVTGKKPKVDAKEKLKGLIQSMIDDKAKLEASNKSFQSKMPYTDTGFKKPKQQKPVETESEEDVALKKAAKDVAASFKEDSQKAEAEILAKILDGPKRMEVDWKEFIAGMAVDTSEQESQIQTRAAEVKFHLKGRRTMSHRQEEKMKETIQESGVFEGTPLGLFSKDTLTTFGNKGPELTTWKYFHEKDMELSIAHPPSNYFQKMIMWTKQEKVWKFPIDNEQGMEKENEVHFSDHIFLETHLEGWCPDKGPIRHFMELVCIGLSKNPYVSVADKKDHIMWYKDYFEARKDVLIGAGAWHEEKVRAE